MRKRKIRSLITWFLILTMFVSFIPEASAGVIKDLNKTVSPTPDQNGDLEITLTVSGLTFTQNQPLNLMFVIDVSGSMAYGLDGSKNPGTGNSRLAILQKALTDTDCFLDSLQAQVGKGNLNIDIVTFSKTATNTLGWTNDLTTVKRTINELKADGGTNYQDALAKAQAAATGMSDVHVIFLSDGEPTCYGTRGTSSFGTSCSVANLEATLTQMSSYATDPNITFRAAIAYATTPTFTATTHKNWEEENDVRYQNVNLLGPAGKNVSGTCEKYKKIGSGWGTYYDWVADTSQDLETRSTPTIGYNAYQTANNESDLLESLNAIVKGFNLSSVSIKDPMHQTHISEKIDLASLHAEEKLKVYLVSEDGSETPLSYGEDYTVTGDTINYLPDLKAGEILKVVATVKVSDSPGEIYFENQAYPDMGNQGFFSNETASASGKVDNEDYSGNYLNPVFKLNTTSLTIKKVSSVDNTQNLAGATFTITRKADSSSTTGVTRSETSKSEDGETISNPVTYTTGEDGTVTIPNLPYGYYELTETAAPEGFQTLGSPLTFSVDYLGHITPNDKRLLDLTATSTDRYTATVTNTPSPVTLTVTKTLEGTAKNTSDTFQFTLSATKYPDYVTEAEKVTGVSKTIGQNGSLSITVPYGTTVEVKEVDSKGYKATVNRTEGQAEVLSDWAKSGTGYSGTITVTKDTTVSIVNTKNAPVVTGFITDTSGTSGIALVSITMISLGALLIYLKKRHF